MFHFTGYLNGCFKKDLGPYESPEVKVMGTNEVRMVYSLDQALSIEPKSWRQTQPNEEMGAGPLERTAL